MSNGEPPNKKDNYFLIVQIICMIAAVLLLLCTLYIAFQVFFSFLSKKALATNITYDSQKIERLFLSAKKLILEGVEEEVSLTLIQDNSIEGAFSSESLQLIIEKAAMNELLEEIIRRESGGNPEICNENGCRYGIGLCMFISSTWNSTLERMRKENVYMPEYCWEEVSTNPEKNHPIFDPTCHLIACEWLFRTDGIKHWESEDGSWGSGPYDLKILDIAF